VIKTKEMIEDYRKRRTEHAPILIDGAVVEQLESFQFLGVHITNKLEWSKHTKTVVKRARQNLFPNRRFGMGPQILKRFYRCIIESMVASLPGMATARPPTARHYRGQYVRPSTSLGPSFLPSRTSIPGGVRGRP
jgi:hypothetical protein